MNSECRINEGARPSVTESDVSDSVIQDVICGMGFPVGGNPTQYLMERSFAAAGLDTRFMTFEVVPEKMADALAGMKALNFKGGALLTPHASLGQACMDRLSTASRLSQASNCLVREGDQWVGHNTLGEGFLDAVSVIEDWEPCNVAILGLGAVGRSIAASLADKKVGELLLLDEDAERGQNFVAQLGEQFERTFHFHHWVTEWTVPDNIDLFVQATPVGWCDPQARLPIKVNTLCCDTHVMDVNYNPPETRFIREALSRGASVTSGIELLVFQSAHAFKKWTGIEADIDLIRESAEEYLEI